MCALRLRFLEEEVAVEAQEQLPDKRRLGTNDLHLHLHLKIHILRALEQLSYFVT